MDTAGSHEPSDIVFLKAIKVYWQEFGRITKAIEAICKELGDSHLSLISNFYHGMPIPLSVLEDLREDVMDIVALRSTMAESETARIADCLRKIEAILECKTDEKTRQRIFGESEDMLKQFFGWYSKNAPVLIGFLDHIAKSSPKELADDMEGTRRMVEKVSDILYDFSRFDFEFKADLAYEIDALIRAKSMQLRNMEIAAEVCAKRRLDIFCGGLLVHNTRGYRWSRHSIVRFIRKGLQSSNMLGANFHRLFPDMVSFFLTTPKSDNHEFYEGDVAFIIDPAFTRRYGSHFRYNDERTREWDSVDFADTCIGLGFRSKAGLVQLHKGSEWANEVQCDMPIPFGAICGLVVVNERYRERMLFFMQKLAQTHPMESFPVYDKEGRVIWP